MVEIGAPDEGFAFDNERPRHPALLLPYRLASRLITNAEYLDFINDKGYLRPELWLSDGWDTVCREAWTCASLLGEARRPVVRVQLARHESTQSRSSRQPRQLLRG